MGLAWLDHRNDDKGARLYRTYGLYNRSVTFHNLLSDKLMRDVASRMLGPRYTVIGYTAYIVGVGSKEGRFHMDGPARLAKHRHHACPVLTALIYLNGATTATGATKVVQGSHLWTEDDLTWREMGHGVLEDAAASWNAFSEEPQISLEADVGSVIFVNGKLFHAAGASDSTPGIPRVTLVLAFAIEDALSDNYCEQPGWVGHLGNSTLIPDVSASPISPVVVTRNVGGSRSTGGLPPCPCGKKTLWCTLDTPIFFELD